MAVLPNRIYQPFAVMTWRRCTRMMIKMRTKVIVYFTNGPHVWYLASTKYNLETTRFLIMKIVSNIYKYWVYEYVVY